MTSACARALRICALLALPASAFAQSTRSPTIFSASSQVGTATVRVAVVLPDYSVKPLPLLKVVARRADRPDSVSAQTDLDGRVWMTLPAGRYTLRAKTAKPVEGRIYTWNVPLVIRAARNETLQLTNANATASDSVTTTTVAAAPEKAAPAASIPAHHPASAAEKPVAKPLAEKPVAAKPADRPASVVDPQTVVARDSVKPAASTPPSYAAPSRPAVRSEPRTNTTNLMLGLSLNGSAVRGDDLNSSTESGAGLAAQIGWGFTKNFALILDASAARIETVGGNFDLAHVDIGGRWHFVSASHGFVPFLEVGYSGRAAMENDVLMVDSNGNTFTGDLSILGSGISFGGGLQYFIGQTWALGGAFKWTTGEFTQVKIDNLTIDGLGIDATSARFNMGLTWFPMGRSR
ncbi:MAG TPA: hypothetical protein VFZ21_08575 [Gemmatimonadaceae bacterium]|jgi:hypothetical protein|nr:hypothetical protein [Gemmatimonadaceae bacterium]